MKKSNSSFYSYIINILTLAKIYKAKIVLNERIDALDEIINESLKALDEFEELDTLNPHQNLSLKLKILIKNEDSAVLIKEGKKEDEILTFTPSLTKSLKEDLDERLNEIFLNPKYSYEITNLINQEDLKISGIIKEDYPHPIYLLTIKVKLDSSKIIKKGFKFTNDLSNLNALDSYILLKGE